MVHELIADSIVVSYGDKMLLSDVSLNCRTGDIIGLFGRNGTGKSTLLKVLFGTIKAESMFLSIDGVKRKLPFVLKNGLSYLPQHRFIPKGLRVKRAIELFLEKNESMELLTDQNIVSITRMKIRELSFGQLRYLEVRLILAIPNCFSLLDEPFQGLSPILVDQLKAIIVVASLTKGIIIVDHNSTAVLDITTKDYWLRNACLTLLKDKSYLYDYSNLL